MSEKTFLGSLPFANPNSLFDRFGVTDILLALRDLSLLLSLKPTGAGTGTHWDSIGVLEKGFAA